MKAGLVRTWRAFAARYRKNLSASSSVKTSVGRISTVEIAGRSCATARPAVDTQNTRAGHAQERARPGRMRGLGGACASGLNPLPRPECTRVVRAVVDLGGERRERAVGGRRREPQPAVAEPVGRAERACDVVHLPHLEGTEREAHRTERRSARVVEL